MLKKGSLFCAAAIALSGAFLFTGCNKKIEGNEKTHPTYIKAKADLDSGRYKDAADGLNDLLNKAPRSKILHKELATIYGDNICDYYRAIYHYQRYLELDKQLSPDDKRAILGFINGCKRNAAKLQVQEDPTIVTEVGGGKPAIDPATAQKLEILQKQSDAFKAVFLKYREQIETLKAENEKLRGEAESAKSSKSAAASSEASSDAAPETTGEYDTYTVKSGDTISRICRKNYGRDTAAYRKMVMDANGLTSASKIRIGQELKLPKLPK